MSNLSKCATSAQKRGTPQKRSSKPIAPNAARFPAEDDAIYNRMDKEIDEYTKEIARLERIEARDAELAKAVSSPITEKPAGAVKEKTGRASDAYKEDFACILRGKPVLHNVLSTSPDVDGGYLVPEEFENQIVTGLEETNVIRSIAKVITTSAERKIPIAATHSIAQWTLENAAYTESNPTFDQKTVDSFKLTDLVKVSVELLQDSYFDLEAYIVQEFARAFGAAEEEAFCIGTGTGQPTGIFNATNGGHVGVTAGSATAITLDNLLDLIYALKAPYRKNAKFFMKDTTVSAIRKLKDNNGAYLWQPSVQAISRISCSAMIFTPALMSRNPPPALCLLLLATSITIGSPTAPAEPSRNSLSFMPVTVR
jgi:HK97 family phage major capsid protein